eukprot:CAMPEP_0118646322 /NCGR_PEP_ID=MMETSP0785-20121206/7991_1 /TAXON_ID=91992 /ORGANISM="Bolidomonas pacifica, Strain CCMP 1866" /LENGTH=190 /DNA_ID=CAMNT_0006538301 /DNA_START=246 /DNA_END=815 /DNA_ORIENTATION=+
MSAWTLGGNVVKGAGKFIRGGKASALASSSMKEEDENDLDGQHSFRASSSLGSFRRSQNKKRYVNVNARKNFNGHLKIHDEEGLRGVMGCLPTQSEGGWGIDTELIEVAPTTEEEEKERARIARKVKAKRSSMITAPTRLTGEQKERAVDGEFMKLRKGILGGIREKMEAISDDMAILRQRYGSDVSGAE